MTQTETTFSNVPLTDREAAIRAWEEDATLHRCGSRFDDDDPRATYLMARSEITAAVALMRSAGDGKALLRELRAKATTPAPEREVKIKAWEKWALEDAADSDLYDDCFVLERHEIENAVALMRSAGDGKELLRELREDLEVYPDGIWTTREMVAKIGLLLAQPAPVEQPSATPSRFDERASELRAMLSWVEYQPCLRDGITAEVVKQYLGLKIKELEGQPSAPVEQPAAAVPDHVPDAGKMVPVLYWLEDGKFARAMLVGKDLLVVDLTFGDGPSVVGKPEWFDAGYVAAYGGLVPESATRGKEPGQWDYGVASIAKPSAVPDDTRELVAQLGHFVCMRLRDEANRATVREIIAKLRGGA